MIEHFTNEMFHSNRFATIEELAKFEQFRNIHEINGELEAFVEYFVFGEIGIIWR